MEADVGRRTSLDISVIYVRKWFSFYVNLVYTLLFRNHAKSKLPIIMTPCCELDRNLLYIYSYSLIITMKTLPLKCQ
jgi:hypothetical protein